MKFSVLSIFPDFFRQAAHGNFLRAWEEGKFQIELINPRSFTQDVHQSVDDRPFGGGDGMILKPGPLAAAIDHAQSQGGSARGRVLYLSPQGKPLNQETLERLRQYSHLILVCGRYGGIDERVLGTRVDEEISLGDFVLSGGEIAALALMDAMSRFIPGVLGHSDSPLKDSFASGVLEEPLFTRPADWENLKVPEVLTRGDHEKIRNYRQSLSFLQTWKKRPDLMRQKMSPRELQQLQIFWENMSDSEKTSTGFRENPLVKASGDLHLALVHYPMLDSKGQIVATNITNFDIHDIARACRTYGVKTYTLVHPMQEQLMFVHRILDHWRIGQGSRYNPSRKRALERVQTCESVEKLRREIQPDLVLATHARAPGVSIWPCSRLRDAVLGGKRVLILFGTGSGFPDSEFPHFDGVLESLHGPPPDDFRHLSVRSAVSIYLDRLLAP